MDVPTSFRVYSTEKCEKPNILSGFRFSIFRVPRLAGFRFSAGNFRNYEKGRLKANGFLVKHEVEFLEQFNRMRINADLADFGGFLFAQNKARE
ncbi:MAG: hypothetical protein JSS81_27910 [Acidobacteria bacterium]|nr:hypothetical protein [Acidobacteriota bacterium]